MCQVNINECESSPCMSGSECYDLIDGFYCKCLPGYTGRTCSIDIDECSSEPCQNKGKCNNLINRFECDCTGTGFTGQLCQENINDCLDVKCEHNSSCIDGINDYKCSCHSGYEGKLCEIDINECISSPCIHGQCWENSDKESFKKRIQYLSNLPTTRAKRSTSSSLPTTKFIDLSFSYNFNYEKAAGYWCECKPGYTGSNCETKINECEHEPCGSNGICLDLVNQFKCECFPGYKGTTCGENINECDIYKPCANFTQCIDIKPDYTVKNNPQEAKLGYLCDCSMLNKHLLKQNGNGYVSYTGQNCTKQLNSCETLNHLCMHNSTCISTSNINEKHGQDVSCSCQPGFSGKYCQYVTGVRFDGTYSLREQLESDNIELSFDFKLKFFNEKENKLPLVLFEAQNKLLLEINVHRHFISIKNNEATERLAFYYPYSTAPDIYNDYNNIWHSLDIKLTKQMAQIKYSVKKLHLIESKTIHFKASTSPNSITFEFARGKNNLMLNGACIRDVTVNNKVLYKLNPFISLTNEAPKRLIKYGCQHTSNQCPSSDNICMNNSTCIHRWFKHECIECQLPFYGQNCHLKAKKLAFIQPRSELLLQRTNEATNTFQISFQLTRISQPTNTYGKFFFSTLKQSDENSETSYYYLLGINENGFINLKKILFDGAQRLTQWSLTNKRINVNQLESIRISLKLSVQFIEISLNNEFMSRYEIVSKEPTQNSLFRIDEIKFANTFLNKPELFILQELYIMNARYEFNNNNKDHLMTVQPLQTNTAITTAYSVNQSTNLNMFDLTLQNERVVEYLNENFCTNKSQECYELGGSRKEIGSARSMLTKTLQCSTQQDNPCTSYSSIEHNLFPSTQLTTLAPKISYYFDFDIDSGNNNKRSTSPAQIQQQIIGYSSFNQHERLIRMRDFEFYSISFDARLHVTPNDRASQSYATTSKLFQLNTFDNLSRNKIFLFGLDIQRAHSQQHIRFKISNKHKSNVSIPILITEQIVNLNVTFTSGQINLELNGKIILTVSNEQMLSTALIKAHGLFMLNFANNQNHTTAATATNSLTSICLSSFKLATRKATSNETSLLYHYSLIQRTKKITVSNYNEVSNQKCRYEMNKSEYEHDELPARTKSGSFVSNDDCLLIEKINIETNEKLDSSYHCKCNGSDSCPYSFWSNSKAAQNTVEAKNIKVDCDQAGDYACFNNGTCVDSLTGTNNSFGYNCECESFYTGQRCEKFDPCLNNPCSINSQCLTNNELMTYECKCDKGYEGRNCTIDVSIQLI